MKGPRYWEQTISAGQDGGGGGALAALYSSGALPVQLQRWALSYVQDPSGVRGLLSQAFDEVRCTPAQHPSFGKRGVCCMEASRDHVKGMRELDLLGIQARTAPACSERLHRPNPQKAHDFGRFLWMHVKHGGRGAGVLGASLCCHATSLTHGAYEQHPEGRQQAPGTTSAAS